MYRILLFLWALDASG